MRDTFIDEVSMIVALVYLSYSYWLRMPIVKIWASVVAKKNRWRQ
ncbi:hypothetical protein ACFL27_04685 [candidate division CSSED10-310 bacterium]|uniref:Uncharacterized protein n=1 Tax=candidate division CSSED10-310 bacterium TaxID=2855610 RepID=A0ABV6YTH9_UNCC1